MIRGVHAMFYSSQAEELRAFIRDKFGLPSSDVGGGWLIFDVVEAEVGVHPADESHAHSRAGTHAISFYCDDIQQTVAELKEKGVEFVNEIADQGFGLITQFKMPGGVVADLYQPLYKKETAPRATVSPLPVQAAPQKPTRPRLKKQQRKARTVAKKKAAAKKPAARKGAKKGAKKAQRKKK